MEYTQKTVTLRWEGKPHELGTLDCPADPSAEGAEVAFLAEAILALQPCYAALDSAMPPQARFLLTVRALAQTYLGRRDQALEHRLATMFMKMYWDDWCKMMDPDGRHGPPPAAPVPVMN